MDNTKIPHFRRCVIQNFPFIEEDFDALTDYGLMSKIVEYLNKVIDKANEFDKYYDELNAAFVQLKSYVDNYFANLDVQEEINTKLEDMADSGQLQEIIAAYLQLSAILAFDTKSSLKEAQNIIDGSTAMTLGQNTYDDGKITYYKIREKHHIPYFGNRGLNVKEEDFFLVKSIHRRGQPYFSIVNTTKGPNPVHDFRGFRRRSHVKATRTPVEIFMAQ